MSISNPPSLSSLSDPGSLAKLQILLVPVHTSTPLQDHTFNYWSNLLKRHTVLRGDELARPSPSTHTRGSTSNPRSRFLPASSSTSISRGGAPNHVHLVYPSHPPARHLANLSLLRIAAFPLVVIGIAAEQPQGYSIEEEDGDIGGSSKTPTVSTFREREKSIEESFGEALAEVFPPSSPFPLVKRLIVVPPDAPISPRDSPKKNGHSGRFTKTKGEVLFAPSEGVEGWLGRLLGEVVGDALGELGELATALETPSGLKTLSSTLLPSLTSTLPHPHLDQLFPGHRSATPTDGPSRSSSTTPVSIPHSQSVNDLSRNGVGISLTRALTPGGRPTSVGPPSQPPIHSHSISPSPTPTTVAASSNPFRRSTALSSPFTRSSSTASLASQASASPAQTMTGTKYTTANLHGLAGGRLLKLLGDMYLLAGMYTDAIRCYDDGAERCRAVGDILWEGVAREGRAVAGIGEAWEGRDGSNMTQAFPNHPIPVEILSHLLSALACISRAPLPYPPTILSPSPQAVSGSLSFSAPSTSNPSAIGTGEGLLAYLHTGLALRISHFLLIIWAAGGWGSIALSALLSHTLPRSFPPPLSTEEQPIPDSRRKRKRILDKLGTTSMMSRHSIIDHAEAALGPHHRAMTKSEQLALHVEVVWLARWLDLPRKEACVTREVVKRIAVMVVEARDEARRIGSAGFRGKTPQSARSDASVGLGLGMAVSAQAVAVRRKESSDGNTGVVALFERALGIMGIDLLEAGEVSSDSRFGWPELQVEMMKEGIAIAEALPDNTAVVRLCTTALHSLHSHLNPPSQAHVAKMFPGALAAIKRRGGEMGLAWWVPGKVVLSLELASLPLGRLPVEHSSAEIVQDGKRDPFLYNPRMKAVEAGKTVIVANEQVDVFVTLQNPFAFDLELQDVSLITHGVDFSTNPLAINLPANSVQAIRVSGIATTPGSLQIRGVSLRLPDGSASEFLLPLLNDTDRQKRDKRKSRLTADLSKAKRQGMEARWSIQSLPHEESAQERWLECKVVEEQPLVWIKKTSLTHGTVMLYNGESSTIRITLENSSSVPVDFVKLSFEDSASRIALAVLNEGEVSREQAYELEYDMIKRPVFVWSPEGEVGIPPGGRTTISVTCLGKVGCTDGSIRIDYGYLKRDGAIPTTFQTRQITFPVMFTVYHTLEPHSLDLVRLTPQDAKKDLPKANGFLAPAGPSRKHSGMLTPRTPSFQTIGEALLTEALQGEMDEAHCLLGLCVRNVYGQPFEIALRRKGDGEVVASRLVPPGSTERLILPVPRLSLDKELLSRPIPTLSERQYVVDKAKKTPEQVTKERELFWSREHLLDSLEATWVEPGSKRSGVISLRGQGLSTAHLDVLRLDDLDITLKAASREGGAISVTEFTDITLTITNRLDRPIIPYIRIEPLPSSSFDTSWTSTHSAPRRPQSTIPVGLRNIVFDGSTSTLLDLIGPGESVEHVVGAVFLAKGEYGLRGVVEEVEQNQEPRVRFSSLLRVKVE